MSVAALGRISKVDLDKAIEERIKKGITKMDYHLENLNALVFIADGARWIWKRVEQHYSESIQIVGYYHCKEHLCEFAKLYYKDEKQRYK